MDIKEEKICPRCHNSLACKAGDIANCDCTAVQLSNEAALFLSKTTFDCLCKKCLVKINRDVKVAAGYSFPEQKQLLIEGLHFYKENGYWVFTELYHLLRGYCCKSGCRHCVYGFKPNK